MRFNTVLKAMLIQYGYIWMGLPATKDGETFAFLFFTLIIGAILFLLAGRSK